jgi:hypothetical protein
LKTLVINSDTINEMIGCDRHEMVAAAGKPGVAICRHSFFHIKTVVLLSESTRSSCLI